MISESGFSISVTGVDRDDGECVFRMRIVVGVSASGFPISVTGVDKGDGDGVDWTAVPGLERGCRMWIVVGEACSIATAVAGMFSPMTEVLGLISELLGDMYLVKPVKPDGTRARDGVAGLVGRDGR